MKRKKKEKGAKQQRYQQNPMGFPHQRMLADITCETQICALRELSAQIYDCTTGRDLHPQRHLCLDGAMEERDAEGAEAHPLLQNAAPLYLMTQYVISALLYTALAQTD